jgi:hypothetical protein
MIEILTVMDFFKRNQRGGQRPALRSAHVCEGPGGFIEALLHLSGKYMQAVDNSWAMTLKPTKQNIPGWKRAYHFLRKSPMVQIHYGADDTGDIMVPANQEAFLDTTRGICNIFTADGGFDFSEHYSTQEEEVFPLLVSSSIIGLQTLAQGGDFVLKVFDTELQSTHDLLTLLASCFEQWTLYKPALSRPCNAEKYFLGRGFHGVPSWIINTLCGIRDMYTKNKNFRLRRIFTYVSNGITCDIQFLKEEYLKEQIAALHYAISHKNEWNKSPQNIWKLIQQHSSTWCREFHIPTRGPFSYAESLTGVSHMHSRGVVQP